MFLSGRNNFESFQAITPSDTALTRLRGIYVGGAGNITISPDATTAPTTFTAVPVGTILWVGLNQGRVMATGTTATLLIGLI